MSMMKAGPLFGHSSRQPYDKCYYPDRLYESTEPVNYRLNEDYIHHCNRCFSSGGAAPRGAFGDSTNGGRVGVAPKNDLVDVDSVCRNLNVKINRCKRGKINPLNLTKGKMADYNVCDNYLEMGFSKLNDPPSNYRDINLNRFYNLHHNPQETIFWNFSHNTKLEAKDNFVPEIPELWGDMSLPKETKGKPMKIAIGPVRN